jgi:hypothetical protein
MAGELLRVADSVVQRLNAGPFSQAFTAQRLYLPQFELPEMATLHVSVVPKEEVTQFLSRGQLMRTCTVEVGVQKKLEQIGNEQIDALVMLVNEIADAFNRLKLDAPNALCTATKPNPIYAPEHLDQLRQFTSVITLKFKVYQ